MRALRSSVAVPQPVFAEIAYGIERLPKSRKKDALRQRYELLRAELPRAVWNEEVTDAFGRIKSQLERRGQRIEDFDAAIAAHAADDDAVLVMPMPTTWQEYRGSSSKTGRCRYLSSCGLHCVG